MRESELLSHIYLRSSGLARDYPHVLVGPGDDCAVLASPDGPGRPRLLVTVDQLVESRHFRPGTPLDLIARKAVARSVSDIAAMGGSLTPFGAALATAALPPDYPQSHADALFDALAAWALHWNCPLVGGDIASFPTADPPGPLTLTVTVLGIPHPTRGPVLRSTAQIGDAVYVTGHLGGSLDPATGLGRHLTFEPRLAEAVWLCDCLGGHLHAMMDISDGLGRDGARLAAASGVALELDAASIPCAPGVLDWRRAIADGEDYEMLFTADPGAKLPAACPSTATPLIRIGTVAPPSPRTLGRCLLKTGDSRMTDISEAGWEHGHQP